MAVSSQLQLVAQREALRSLQTVNAGYSQILAGWLAMITPAERAALDAYDRLVSVYRISAPMPVDNSKQLH